MTATRGPVTRLRGWAQRQGAEYRSGAERPLGGYLSLMGVYASGTLATAAAARLLGRSAPPRFSPWDVGQLAVATHKVSRLIAKDPVTSPLRAPFTTYAGVSAPSELHEEVRGHGLKHSAGELLTCPMCLAQWVATAFTAGLVLAPRPTDSRSRRSPRSPAPTSCSTPTCGSSRRPSRDGCLLRRRG